MRFTPRMFPLSLLLLTTLAFASAEQDDHGHDDRDVASTPNRDEAESGRHEEAAEGPHGGRLLSDGPLGVEVTIFETGVEPQLRLFVFEDGKAVNPAGAIATVTLQRLGRPPERLAFRAVDDFLLGDRIVAEPHSFEVEVEISFKGRTLKSRYETLEARVTLAATTFAANEIGTETASSRDLGRSLRLSGRIGIPGDRIVDVHPRFAGVIREAEGTIGQSVRRGQPLAVVESDQSLSRYDVVSPIDGVVLERRAVAGATVGRDDVLYSIADLHEVWADLDVYGADTAVIRVGETVTVHDGSHGAEADATLSYVSPLRDVHTQTTLARAVLDNRDGRWAPGAFITATVRLEEPVALIAVPASALQTWRSREAVFVVVGDVQEVRPVRVGRRGEEWVEVLEGLVPGDVVAVGNTFLLRAEIEKAGATHDH